MEFQLHVSRSAQRKKKRSLYLDLLEQVTAIMGGCAEFDISNDDAQFLLNLKSGGDLILGRVASRPYDGNFSVPVMRQLKNGQPHEAARLIRGRMFQMQEVVVAARKLGIGDFIAPGDIHLTRVRADRVPGQASKSVEALLGMQIKWPVQPNAVVLKSQIQAPNMIEKGAPVTVLFEAKNLMLSMPAQALENGTNGQVIEVQNFATNRRIRARVRDSLTVTIN